MPSRSAGENYNWVWIVGVVWVLLVVLFLGYRYVQKPEQVVNAGAAAVDGGIAEAPPPEAGEAQYPVPETETPIAGDAPALPPLSGSDDEALSAASALIGEAPVEAFLVPQDVIRRFVVMVDTLPSDKVSLRTRSIRRIDGKFQVEADGQDGYRLLAGNAGRYRAFAQALQAMDTERAVDLYFRYYPLFQRAYEELGYKGRYFNDRVIAVIDHLLDTPELPDTVELLRPNVLYVYKDPALEGLSAGQKALLRTGNENSTIIKHKLGALRAEIASRSAPDS